MAEPNVPPPEQHNALREAFQYLLTIGAIIFGGLVNWKGVWKSFIGWVMKAHREEQEIKNIMAEQKRIAEQQHELVTNFAVIMEKLEQGREIFDSMSDGMKDMHEQIRDVDNAVRDVQSRLSYLEGATGKKK